MFTRAIIEGIGKIVWIRKDSNRQKNIARIYDLTAHHVPERVLEEAIPGSGLFKDRTTKERFVLNHQSQLVLI